jgi:hypothetical protein
MIVYDFPCLGHGLAMIAPQAGFSLFGMREF